ncbi:MAG: outer membrane receptor for ferrienterochelin and colicin [bacterium P3]|nr:MAG: outer membrane receptor for ferrienterochelin and colicin [bacterium P3]KWW42010.1 MAG: outer membrane receptor for ferrienterochelin and colicin [bacterium F083]
MSLSAQVCVTGRVTDARDGHALEYVHAGVVDGVYKAVGVSTDRAGRYVLCVPAAVSDSIDVRFSFTGYETQWHRIASRQSDTLVLDVSLRIGATTLREVTVTGEARSNNGFTPISTALLDDVAGPGSGVESLVKTLPDVASNNELSSQYSVRGGSFDENLVYVNGVEVFRPMLVRSGQQEGLSLVNPDMVDHLYFSPGGFDARYGDKMSSVLDVNYNRPDRFGMRLSASLLGASARLSGPLGADWGYSVGFRHHSNNYLLGSLDTKGTYRTAYTDLQAVVGGALSEQWSLSLLAIVSRNRYSLVPESQTTTFGSFMESLELNVYFDGEEVDAYSTLLGASTLSWHPSEQTQIDWTVSAQQMVESERYDIQSQYWLYEVGMGGSGDMQRFDRGVGTFLEHARNRLYTQIFTSSLRGTRIVGDGVWLWGLAAQAERVSDRLREWKWVDSAGYAIPAVHGLPGTDTVGPYSPVLQSFSRADNRLSTLRASAYVQREVDWSTAGSYQWRFTAGLRAMSYSTVYQARLADSVERRHVVPLVLSPRVSLGLKPAWEDRDVFFRLALGVYQQAPFYREDRCPDGSLNIPDHPQRSYQAVATFDRKMQLWDKPFKFTADLYYKYITHLVPYSVDNLRVRYDARNDATGYATGISLRLNGELVEGLESWASLSLMHTQEDIRGDGMGWLPRPTDQRLSFKLFLQDNLPALPWWRMSLNFVYGTGVPVVFAHQRDRSQTHRLPAYFRVDWSNSVRLSRFPFYRHSVLRCFSETLVGLEVYNLFNHRNVASYIWVSDYDNIYYPVPNYLTARQLNVRITLEL